MAKRKTLEAPAACPRCSGYGYVIDEATNTASRCDCGLTESIEGRRRMATSNIPPKFSMKDLRNYEVRAGDIERKKVRDSAFAYASSFDSEESPGLLLRGGTGSGKTHVAVAIMKEAMRRGYSAHYANFSDLLSRIRDSYHENSKESEGALLALIDSVDLLVLDDVGAENTTDWVRDRLYLIINRRYENARPVIITTNCEEAELEARIGPRTASRLYEMCSMPFPPFPRQDYRKAMMR